MPRIPRRSEGSEETPPADQPTQISSGDPLAPPTSAAPTAGSSGDPVADKAQDPPVDPPTEVTPSTDADQAGATAAPEAQATDADQAAATAAPEAQATDADQAGATAAPEAPPAVAAEPVEQPTSVLPDLPGPVATPPQSPAETDVSAETGEQAPADARPRFRQRTRMRRRLRYLRRLRELAFRDLGGLVFDLHRFGRDRGDLVGAKLEALANLDRELRTLQDALGQRLEFTDLREAGIAACARCGTLHDTDANYCPGCGATLRSVLVREAFPVTVTAAGDAPAESPAPQQPTPSS